MPAEKIRMAQKQRGQQRKHAHLQLHKQALQDRQQEHSWTIYLAGMYMGAQGNATLKSLKHKHKHAALPANSRQASSQEARSTGATKAIGVIIGQG